MTYLDGFLHGATVVGTLGTIGVVLLWMAMT